MDRTVRQLGQLRQVAPDELALRIETFALRDRVEDAEVGLRIAAAGAGPLPATIVRCQLEVVEVFGEIGFAPAPIDPQVLAQEAGSHHAQPVVHVAGLVDLRHRRVDQRIPGAALAPRLEQAIGVFAGVPPDLLVLGLEAVRHTVDRPHVRKVRQHLRVEIAPDQFAQPGRCARVAMQRELMGQACELADRHRAETQVHAEVAWSAHGRVIARILVPVDALEKIVEQRGGAATAGRDVERRQVGFFKPESLERRDDIAEFFRCDGQRRSVGAHRIGPQVERIQLRLPGPLVRGEHGVRLTDLGQHFAALENHLVLVGVERDADVGERTEHLCIAHHGGRLVVVIGKHRLHVERMRQGGDVVDRRRVPHDQHRLCMAGEQPKVGLQGYQRFANELDSPVDAWQQVEDVPVEDEHANHFAAGPERTVQRCLIVHTQIASEPEQAFGIDLVGGR